MFFFSRFFLQRTAKTERPVNSTHAVGNGVAVLVRRAPEYYVHLLKLQQNQKSGELRFCWYGKFETADPHPQSLSEIRK